MGQLVGDASGLQAARTMVPTIPAILSSLLFLPDRPHGAKLDTQKLRGSCNAWMNSRALWTLAKFPNALIEEFSQGLCVFLAQLFAENEGLLVVSKMNGFPSHDPKALIQIG